MEIYVDLILEKLSKQNIYRKTFDSKNKIQLIAMIAEKIILKKDNYTKVLTNSEFQGTIHEYLKEKVGFTYDEGVIVNYLFERKIFTKTIRNEVKFSQVCFLHFFVAKRMQENLKFKKYILDESRYFNYYKEIDYYTGLVRSDLETFNLLFTRFKKVFEPMEFILKSINPDDYFNINLSKAEMEVEPLARNIEVAKIKENRPTDEKIEYQLDEQLTRISKSQKSEEIKNIDFDRMLLIMCNVLRNSESIENLDLKKEAYNEIIKHNITYSILYTQLLIRYIIQHKKLPPSIPPNVSLDYVLKNLPYHIQESLNIHLGTQKLEVVILDKINKDAKGTSNTNSEIEKYLSVTLFSDIQGHKFDNHLKKLVKSAKSIPVQNYLLYKLTEYLYKRSKEGSDNEEMYLDLISELKIKSQKLPRRFKEQIVKNLLDKKKKLTKYIS